MKTIANTSVHSMFHVAMTKKRDTSQMTVGEKILNAVKLVLSFGLVNNFNASPEEIKNALKLIKSLQPTSGVDGQFATLTLKNEKNDSVQSATLHKEPNGLIQIRETLPDNRENCIQLDENQTRMLLKEMPDSVMKTTFDDVLHERYKDKVVKEFPSPKLSKTEDDRPVLTPETSLYKMSCENNIMTKTGKPIAQGYTFNSMIADSARILRNDHNSCVVRYAGYPLTKAALIKLGERLGMWDGNVKESNLPCEAKVSISYNAAKEFVNENFEDASADQKIYLTSLLLNKNCIPILYSGFFSRIQLSPENALLLEHIQQSDTYRQENPCIYDINISHVLDIRLHHSISTCYTQVGETETSILKMQADYEIDNIHYRMETLDADSLAELGEHVLKTAQCSVAICEAKAAE